MKRNKLLSIALMASVAACSNAEEKAFNGGVTTETIQQAQNAEPEVAETGDDQVPSAPAAEAAAAPIESEVSETPAVQALSLEVVLPSTEIRAGSQKLQAVAVLTGESSSKIVWSLEGPSNVDYGTINANGLYNSPLVASSAFEVVVVATLEDDPSIIGKKILKVIPAEQIFIGCKKGNSTFPIAADVFELDSKTTKGVPNFSSMSRKDIICLDQINVPVQDWSAGFPGATALKEWFGLQAKAKLIIPESGNYQFKVMSDDGSNFYVNGKLVVNNDGIHSPTEKVSDLVELSLGKHDIRMDYIQGPANQIALQLYWKKPGSSEFVIVPASAFAFE